MNPIPLSLKALTTKGPWVEETIGICSESIRRKHMYVLEPILTPAMFYLALLAVAMDQAYLGINAAP